MYAKLVAACLLFLPRVATPQQPQGWRDFVPLHSTRADVERLLGPPTTDRGSITFYENEKERVTFEYAKNACGEMPGGWNVPRDTVISIRVTPRSPRIQFGELNLDQSRFKRENDKEVGNIVHYIDEIGGVVYDVDTSGDVTLIKYVPAAKESGRLCPSSGQPLTETVKFWSYSDVPFDSEKNLLDAFTAQLRLHTSADGYIMVYAGRRARPGEAAARAQRAKKYLTDARGIDGRRIVAIDGGYREKQTVELYLVPSGAIPPFATPTVDPKEVRITKSGGGRTKKHRFQSHHK